MTSLKGLIFFASLLLPKLGMSKIEHTKFLTAEIMYCSDGDTCRLKIIEGAKDPIWLNVRLAGIDAPETAKKRKKKQAQPFGEEAKTFVNTQLAKKKILLRQVDLDHYNRPIVEIYVGDSLFNLSLLEKGLAEVYKGKTKRIDRALYQTREDIAKKDKIGIWSLNDYVSPKEFRKKH